MEPTLILEVFITRHARWSLQAYTLILTLTLTLIRILTLKRTLILVLV